MPPRRTASASVRKGPAKKQKREDIPINHIRLKKLIDETKRLIQHTKADNEDPTGLTAEDLKKATEQTHKALLDWLDQVEGLEFAAKSPDTLSGDQKRSAYAVHHSVRDRLAKSKSEHIGGEQDAPGSEELDCMEKHLGELMEEFQLLFVGEKKASREWWPSDYRALGAIDSGEALSMADVERVREEESDVEEKMSYRERRLPSIAATKWIQNGSGPPGWMQRKINRESSSRYEDHVEHRKSRKAARPISSKQQTSDTQPQKTDSEVTNVSKS